MAVHATVEGDRGNLRHGVDQPLRVLRGRGDQHDGLIVNRPSHRSGIGPPVIAHGHATHLHTEVGAGFFKGCVRGGWQHHVGASFVVTKLVARGLHRHEDALGAAARKEPPGAAWRPQPACDNREHVCLHRAQRREGIHVESVLAGEPAVGLRGELVGLRRGVIGE